MNYDKTDMEKCKDVIDRLSTVVSSNDKHALYVAAYLMEQKIKEGF